MRKICFLLLFAVSIVAMGANAVDEVKNLIDAGNYSQALTLLQEQYAKNRANALVNYRMGLCYQHMGETAQAIKYYDAAQRRGNKEALMALARCYYDEYDFVNAKSMIEKYETATKNKPMTQEDSRLRARITMAEEMLRHVEKITVIDSLVVDKNEFFKKYRLSAQAGRLIATGEMPEAIRPANSATSAFVPEDGAGMLWSQSDADGTQRLMRADKLLDGSWDSPVQLDDMLNDEGDAAYPFVSADGQNLYYASNGVGSIGGYDIFVTRKDSETGNYLKPQNVGMPYNSPYDDYLLAIDGNTGVGWWATDRNQIAGKVTIYIYIPNATRVNYNADSIDVSSMAAIKRIRDTWEPGADYTSVLSKIENMGSETATAQAEFSFPVSKGVTYTSYADVKTTEGRNLLEQYFSEVEKCNSDTEKLSALRAKYAQAADSERNSMSSQIKQLEQSVRKSREMIDYYANKVRRAEGVK